jgi:SWIM zinc finger
MANDIALLDRVERESGVRPYAVLGDTDRYKHRVQIRSESSDRLYTVSWDTAVSKWKCGCPSGISRGCCKHLDAMIPALDRAYRAQPGKLARG